MAIRAQPVKPLFQRMSRIVREASEATGKPARLVTSGEAAEVDKTLIEQLADPLTNMAPEFASDGSERDGVVDCDDDPQLDQVPVECPNPVLLIRSTGGIAQVWFAAGIPKLTDED